MPAGTGNVATNDEAGQVSFGEIVFTMENVFGETNTQSAERSRTFTYTVTETGEVSHITPIRFPHAPFV